MPRPSQLAYILALASYFALLALVVLWHGWWFASPQYLPRAIIVAAVAAPLLFPLRGLLQGKPYTHAWTGLLALAYLAHGAVEAHSNAPVRGLATLEVGLSAILIVSSAYFARLRTREMKSAPTARD